MDRNMLLQNKLTHSHKTSRKFRAEQYCPPSQGGKKDQTPPTFPPLRRGGGESCGACNASENRSRFWFHGIVLSSADRKARHGCLCPGARPHGFLLHRDSGNQEDEELFGLVPPWE